MGLSSIVVVIVLVVLFASAVIWIAKNGGWTDESQCLGNCSTCDKHCADPKKAAQDTHEPSGTNDV